MRPWLKRQTFLALVHWPEKDKFEKVDVEIKTVCCVEEKNDKKNLVQLLDVKSAGLEANI